MSIQRIKQPEKSEKSHSTTPSTSVEVITLESDEEKEGSFIIFMARFCTIICAENTEAKKRRLELPAPRIACKHQPAVGSATDCNVISWSIEHLAPELHESVKAFRMWYIRANSAQWIPLPKPMDRSTLSQNLCNSQVRLLLTCEVLSILAFHCEIPLRTQLTALYRVGSEACQMNLKIGPQASINSTKSTAIAQNFVKRSPKSLSSDAPDVNWHYVHS